MSQDFKDVLGIIIIISVTIVVTVAAIEITTALTRGPSTPPCRKGGIFKVIPDATEQGSSGTGVLVICRNGNSVWP